jgi:hypothetical protein
MEPHIVAAHFMFDDSSGMLPWVSLFPPDSFALSPQMQLLVDSSNCQLFTRKLLLTSAGVPMLLGPKYGLYFRDLIRNVTSMESCCIPRPYCPREPTPYLCPPQSHDLIEEIFETPSYGLLHHNRFPFRLHYSHQHCHHVEQPVLKFTVGGFIHFENPPISFRREC